MKEMNNNINVGEESTGGSYRNLLERGACARGYVPFFYGYIDRLDSSWFSPLLDHFRKDKFLPRAIVLGYFAEAEKLDCVNYFDDLLICAIDGIREIHGARVHHRDVYPKNMLVVSGTKVVWVDFDVAMTFEDIGDCEKAYCEYEVELKDDQKEGLPPDTKYY
ncbi:hypothetical protein BDW42DRAFT_187947 [Aspergillus taichungensis]|uniref:Protein kinase domain-containing protein n=1 Tax=Aspergillus taichungensis TaxID=482145 RepID=A0A2J5HKK9_9EURO|nr:hypothetical protein BDW42DRAFT_187947 [Aspergillus taichungensis]